MSKTAERVSKAPTFQIKPNKKFALIKYMKDNFEISLFETNGQLSMSVANKRTKNVYNKAKVLTV